MTNKKKLIAAALVPVMALAMTQMTAFAEENTAEEPTDPAESFKVMDTDDPNGVAGETTESTNSSDSEEPVASTDPEPTTEPTSEPTTAPQPVIPKVSVTKKGPALFVSWNSIQGADYYEVYRSYSSASKGSMIKRVSGSTAYTDKAVASGKRAFYQVRAHKADGTFTKYSGTVSDVIYRVYIETGHGIDAKGRWDPGCKWKKYQEAKLMIPICKSMTKYLRSKGVYVYTDAFNGNRTNLNWLMKNLKKYNVSVLVNVHCDYKKAPRGTLPLYRYADQKRLAKCLNAGVHKTVKIKNRGLKARKNLACLNKTHSYCTACLFETGNIRKDNKILRKQYDAYGKGLAMGVCSYLGVKW